MRKGQEEAPVELMVAVIIFTFVLIIGYYVYNGLCAQQFEQKMSASFSKFARDIELVYLGGVGTSSIVHADFTAVGCYGNIHSIRMFAGTEGLCNAQLGSSDCAVLAMVMSEKNAAGLSENSASLVEVLSLPSDAEGDYYSEVPSTVPDCVFCRQDYAEAGDDRMEVINSLTEQCGWHTQAYNFRITKTEPGVLKIEKL